MEFHSIDKIKSLKSLMCWKTYLEGVYKKSKTLTKKVDICMMSDNYQRKLTVPIPVEITEEEEDLLSFYIATLIYNGVAIIGCNKINISLENDVLYKKINSNFFENFASKKYCLPIVEAACAWNGGCESREFTISRSSKIHFKGKNHKEQYNARTNGKESRNEILVLNIGQSEIKIGLINRFDRQDTYITNKVMAFSRFSKGENFIIQNNSTEDVKLFFNEVTNILQHFIDSHTIKIDSIRAILVGISATVKEGKIIPMPNGLSRKLSGVPLSLFANLDKHIFNYFNQAIPVYIENDGILQAWASISLLNLEDTDLNKGILSLRLGTSLSAGFLGNASIMGEFGWIKIDMLSQKDPFETTGVTGLSRSKLSYSGVQNILKERGVNCHPKHISHELSVQQLGSEAWHRIFWVGSDLATWIADTICVARDYIDFDIVVLSGSLLYGVFGDHVVNNIRNQIMYRNKYPVLVNKTSNEYAILKYGMLFGATSYLKSIGGVS